MTIEELIQTFDGSDAAEFAADKLHLLDHHTKKRLAEMMLERILEADCANS